MATLSQSRPTAGHRAQQLQQQTSRPRALQQCQSVILLLRHGLDHEVPAGFIAWRRVPSTANAGTITKSQHFHFDGGTRPPTTSTNYPLVRQPGRCHNKSLLNLASRKQILLSVLIYLIYLARRKDLFNY